MKQGHDPITLDYESPPPAKKLVWSVAMRVLLGLGLSAFFTFLISFVADYSLAMGEVLVTPMGWLGTRINPNISTVQIIFASGVFYGFLVSFGIGRKWQKKSRNGSEYEFRNER